MSGDQPAIDHGDAAQWRELGERLREAREYLGFSQEEVAAALGLPRPAISRFESGQRKVSVLELNRLAALYRRPPAFFTGPVEPQDDQVINALFRTTRGLTERDQEQVLRFAEFLRTAGPPPDPEGDPDA